MPYSIATQHKITDAEMALLIGELVCGRLTGKVDVIDMLVAYKEGRIYVDTNEFNKFTQVVFVNVVEGGVDFEWHV